MGLDPCLTVRPCEPGQGAGGRPGQQTITAASSREDYHAQRDDSSVAYGPAMPGILLVLQYPIGVCQHRDAVVYVLVQRDGRRQELALKECRSRRHVRLYRTWGDPHRECVHHYFLPGPIFNLRYLFCILPNEGCDPSQVNQAAELAVQLTIAVFTSTVHCQDFKDVKGDHLTGRCTVPIMFPVASRLVVGFGLPIWSFVLCCIWDIDWFCTTAFVTYGCFVGGRFLFLRTRDADKMSCKFYSVSFKWSQ